MKRPQKIIGILAFQGGVIEHKKIIEGLGHSGIEVRKVSDLEKCDALIIPGGESTTIGFFLEETGLGTEIKKRSAVGFPLFGTCAGAIVLSKHVEADIIPPHLGLLDISIHRNAYGRQVDSFYADLIVPGLGIPDLRAAFIRAPIITKTGSKVKILARHGEETVLVQQGKILAATFHPELREDPRLHEYFIAQI